MSDYEKGLQKNGSEKYDTFLPPAAESLKVVKDFTPGDDTRSLQLKQCPECATYYLYETDYEFRWGGSFDEQKLTRLTEEEAAEYLKRLVPESYCQ